MIDCEMNILSEFIVVESFYWFYGKFLFYTSFYQQVFFLNIEF